MSKKIYLLFGRNPFVCCCAAKILCPFSDGQPNRWLTGSRYLSFACPKERYQRKRHPKTCWDIQSQYPRIKRKTGTRKLALCSALIALRQMLAIILFLFRYSAAYHGVWLRINIGGLKQPLLPI